jgi:hypothetical protein
MWGDVAHVWIQSRFIAGRDLVRCYPRQANKQASKRANEVVSSSISSPGLTRSAQLACLVPLTLSCPVPFSLPVLYVASRSPSLALSPSLHFLLLPYLSLLLAFLFPLPSFPSSTSLALALALACWNLMIRASISNFFGLGLGEVDSGGGKERGWMDGMCA